MDELLREEALLTINLPGHGCSFPWERFPSVQRQSIQEWLTNSIDFHEWVDHLVIGVYKQEISIDIAMLLAACPTRELEKIGQVSIDAKKFDSYRAQRAFAILCNSNQSLPVCPRHSFDVTHDWWLLKLWPPKWASKRSHKIRSLQKGLPLSIYALRKLECSIAIGKVTLGTVLQSLAIMTRDPFHTMKQLPLTSDSFKTSDALTRYAYIMGGPSQSDAPLKSHEQMEALESLWNRLNRSPDGTVIWSEGIQDDICIEILRAQRNSAILFSKRFQKKIETYWRHSTARPSLMSSLAMCLPRHLIQAVVADMWTSHALHTFKPPSVTLEAVTASAIKSLRSARYPKKLLKLVKGGHLNFEAALWLILIWYWDGEEAALTALAERSIVPGLDLMSPLPFKEQATTCLLLVMPFVNVKIRLRWSRVCRAANELIRTPEMEEKAMVETLNMIPYGLRTFRVSYQFQSYKQEENFHGRDFPYNLISRKLYTWHLFGAYAQTYLETSELETNSAAAHECRIWLPEHSAILVARLRHELLLGRRPVGKSDNLRALLLSRKIPLEESWNITLRRLALKAYLSDDGIRAKTLDVHGCDERPFQVFKAVDIYGLTWRLWDEGVVLGVPDWRADELSLPQSETDLMHRIAQYANVIELDMHKWWVDDPPNLITSLDRESLLQLIRPRLHAVQETELLRLRQWYEVQIAAMLTRNRSVYADDDGWAVGSGVMNIQCDFISYAEEETKMVQRRLRFVLRDSLYDPSTVSGPSCLLDSTSHCCSHACSSESTRSHTRLTVISSGSSSI